MTAKMTMFISSCCFLFSLLILKRNSRGQGLEGCTPEKCFEELDSEELNALYTLFDVEASAPMEKAEGLAALIGGVRHGGNRF